MRQFQYEVFLGDKFISVSQWREFLLSVQGYIGDLRSWSIQMRFEQHIVHYYLLSPVQLPSSIQQEKFMLSLVELPALNIDCSGWPIFHCPEDNCIKLALQLQRKQLQLQNLNITIRGCRRGIIGQAYVIIQSNRKSIQHRLTLASPAPLLSVNFNKNKNYSYKKIPKYINLDKVAKLFHQTKKHSILEIDPFPYSGVLSYLSLEQYDFARHSLILGGSGMGKSKFLATMIHQICLRHHEEYQIVVIDPHDALKHDLAHIPDRIVVDFTTSSDSINLFATQVQSISANIELMLDLFQSLISDNYNSRLERVLRYSIYLLIAAAEFNLVL